MPRWISCFSRSLLARSYRCPAYCSKNAVRRRTGEKKRAVAARLSGSIRVRSTRCARPQHALIARVYRADALGDELLNALALVGFGRVDIALGIGRDAVHAVELPRLAPAVAEVGDLFERLAQNDANFLVRAVGQEHEALLGIAR